MKKVIRIFIIIIISIVMTSGIHCVFAENGDKQGDSSWSTQSPDFWKPDDGFGGEYDVNYRAKKVLGVIRNIGIVSSVIALMIIGIREMTASAEEKSIIKQSLPGYVIGVILIATVTVLPSLIYEVTSSLR